MKNLNYFIIFVGLLVLTGCSERALTFDRVYPDTSDLEEARAEKLRELAIVKDVSTLKKQRTRPRYLHIHNPNSSISAEASQFCWKAKPEDCESIQPIHPNDNLDPVFRGLYYLRFGPNEEITVSPEFLRADQAPFPARVEAYFYDENKNLHFYDAIDKPDLDSKLTTPSNLGSYIFQFIAYYEGEVEGIAYHPIGMNVFAPE